MPKRTTKPNILVIWGDDIGITNLSIYSHGLMGYRTPNIDRIGREGILFTDSYGEQSCTAGRAAFITGQSVYRTGLSKVGLPGADIGLRAEDPTIAELLSRWGTPPASSARTTSAIGTSSCRRCTASTSSLETSTTSTPRKNQSSGTTLREGVSQLQKEVRPRGVLHSWAKPGGGQKIEDTGPLTKKRMETVDDEFLAATKDFITRQHEAHKPFFVWFNATHMHSPDAREAREPRAGWTMAVGVPRRHD